KDFVTYDLHINSNKTIMSGVDLEHLKATLFLAFEGIKISVINDRNAQSQIPIFIRLDDSRNLEKNSKLALNAKLQSLKIM
ncbi:AcrB/AcrD/AcrF family protein, partial [Aliarcobacter butzleri]